MGGKSAVLDRARAGHRWLGTIAGVAMLFVTTTGIIATLNMEMLSWEKPGLRAASGAPIDARALDTAWRTHLPGDPVDFINIDFLHLPGQPAMMSYFRDGRVDTQVFVDPATGAVLDGAGQGAAEFLWRLHGDLWIGETGLVVQGVIGVIMLIMLGLGVVLHRRITRELFRFRARPERTLWSTLHKLLASWSLPFVAAVAVSGVMFALVSVALLPVGAVLAQGDMAKLAAELRGPRPAVVDEAAPMPPYGITEALRAVKDRVGPARYERIQVRKPRSGDAHIVIRGGLLQSREDFSLTLHAHTAETVSFERGQAGIAESAGLALLYFHKAEYAAATSRTLHFLLGVLMLVMIVSGLMVWYRTQTRSVPGAAAIKDLARPAAVLVGGGAGPLTAAIACLLLARWLPAGMAGPALLLPVYYGTFGAAVAFALGTGRPSLTARGLGFVTGALLLALPVTELVSKGSATMLSPGLLLFLAGATLSGAGLVYYSTRRMNAAPVHTQGSPATHKARARGDA